MAGPLYVLDIPMIPQEAMTQFSVVTLRSDLQVELADAQGELGFGVVQEEIVAGDVTLGRVADVRVLGVSRCIANGNLTAGIRVTTDATGKVEAAASGDFVLGVLLTDPAASGDWCDVLLLPSGIPLA